MHHRMQFLWTLFVDTLCKHFFLPLFVNTYCQQFLSTLFVNTFCDPFLWTLFCGPFLWTHFDPFFFWYWCYYPHRSKDTLSPVCGIFFRWTGWKNWPTGSKRRKRKQNLSQLWNRLKVETVPKYAENSIFGPTNQPRGTILVWKGSNKVGTKPKAADRTLLALFSGENGEKLAYHSLWAHKSYKKRQKRLKYDKLG